MIRQVVFHGPGRLELVERELEALGPGDVRISVDGCGVCGSDIVTYHEGHYVQPGQVIGHDITGIVVETGERMSSRLRPGDRVATRPLRSCGECWYCRTGAIHLCGETGRLSIGHGAEGGFADEIIVRDADRTGQVARVDADAAEAVWTEPVAVAVHALRRAQAAPGARALIVGAGPIGLSLVAVCEAAGLAVEVVEPRAARRRAALDLGASPPTDQPVDVVFDASGVPQAIVGAVERLHGTGRLVVVALGDRPLPLIFGRFEVLGSYAFAAADFESAARLISSGRVRLSSAISHRMPLAETEAAIRLAAADPTAVKVVVQPSAP